MNYKILIVDDEPANLRLLERVFRREYQIITASSGVEALELLARYDVAVIISDQRMPQMTGIEFLKRASEIRPNTVRIILTGYTDVNALVEVINSGIIYKYVSKPWVNEDLQQTVSRALEHYETNKRQHELVLHNERLYLRLKETRQAIIALIADTLDLNSNYSREHAARVSSYATIIGQRLDLEAGEIEQLSFAAHLHEAGIVETSNSNSMLTNKEQIFAAETKGLERAVRMLEAVPHMDEVALILRCRDERFDGNGFPHGLGDEQIPLLARILTVACAYDKMICPPESREKEFQIPLSRSEAIRRLQSEAGKRFDPRIVQVFCEENSNSQVSNSASIAFAEQFQQK